MADIGCILATLVFFPIAIAYTMGCDRLSPASSKLDKAGRP